MSDEGK